jgi:protein-L-isoaspartate(D-aspartate) O-methyltransferase
VDPALARRRLVRGEVASRGVGDPRVLDALEAVPRHLFVPPERAGEAYDDRALGIGRGQTISQPTIVGLMTEALALRGGEKVLEVGTGSGYQTAVLLECGARVWTVERLPELSERARGTLAAAGYAPPRFRVGDGSLGWPEEAPFNRIVVTAGAPSVPAGLVAQLVEGGRMVIPVGAEGEQELEVLVRQGNRVSRERICSCSFVKLVGAEGW